MPNPPASDPLELPFSSPRWWIGAVYVVLFALSVPWYLPASVTRGPGPESGSDVVPLWLGLPYWVVISVIATVGVAVFTTLVVSRFWPTDADPVADHRVTDAGRPDGRP